MNMETFASAAWLWLGATLGILLSLIACAGAAYLIGFITYHAVSQWRDTYRRW